jgi:hypothetical protein
LDYDIHGEYQGFKKGEGFLEIASERVYIRPTRRHQFWVWSLRQVGHMEESSHVLFKLLAICSKLGLGKLSAYHLLTAYRTEPNRHRSPTDSTN